MKSSEKRHAAMLFTNANDLSNYETEKSATNGIMIKIDSAAICDRNEGKKSGFLTLCF